MNKEEKIKQLQKELEELQRESIQTDTKTADCVERYIDIIRPSKLGKVGEFDYGDDKCLVFHSKAGPNERLSYIYLIDGKVFINDIELPQTELFDITPIDGDQLQYTPLKQERIKKGIENIIKCLASL